ncbi:MAG: hypothetical protein WCI29_11615 [Actinomycetes bacterium]|jgi:hypothetical protein
MSLDNRTSNGQTSPSRAQSRRAGGASAPGRRAAAPSNYSTVDAGAAGVGQTAPLSRAEQRRIAEESARRAKSGRAIWRAWWLYPLLATAAVCIYLGAQSASRVPDLTTQPIVTITTQP